MRGSVKLIILGDVVAKIGRQAVADVLPRWGKKYKADAVIANVENLAHGKGITKKTLAELKEAGVAAFTGGNHLWRKHDPASDDIRGEFSVACPANDPRTIPPLRWQTIKTKGGTLFILSLEGQLAMHDEGLTSPFIAFDSLYAEMGTPKMLIVDLHAELTSEKGAFGHYTDGRASVVYGTHTHIPTADTRILPDGTGFITDVGMTGSDDSVLGVEKHIIMKRFLGEKQTFEYPEQGPAWINAIFCELDPKTGHCTMIEQLQEKLIIK